MIRFILQNTKIRLVINVLMKQSEKAQFVDPQRFLFEISQVQQTCL